MISELARENEPVRVLNSEFFFARLEARDSEALSDLKSEDFSRKLEAILNEPAKDLNKEDRSAKVEVRVKELARFLKKDPLSTRLEEKDTEPVNALAKALVSEAAIETENELVSDLKYARPSANPEPMVQAAFRPVEQERGIELQITFPESTLATMLPIVIAIDPANVLKIEFFSARVEESVSEPLRDLRNELFSARLDAKDNESLKSLPIPLDWEPVRPIESSSDLNNELCFATVEV